ncbi:hypothetical protein EVAR_29774_1 [Eumeta japonica]|uniref:Uncharacterized protein n=1 Tax=Eumeta variegata TaxID=151549 RepID=A0A4C1WWB7_EUMVA|nr:hypothetical protein EVAR_29774_1 [Eumeta japonica]
MAKLRRTVLAKPLRTIGGLHLLATSQAFEQSTNTNAGSRRDITLKLRPNKLDPESIGAAKNKGSNPT